MPPPNQTKQVPQATATVGTIKVTTTIKASAFPTGLVPLEGPAPSVHLTIDTERGPSLTATFSAKTYRKAVKAMQERLKDGDDPTVIVQGTLDKDDTLIGAGITVAPAKPAAPTQTRPQ